MIQSEPGYNAEKRLAGEEVSVPRPLHLDVLAQRERSLWRTTILLLAIISIGFAIASGPSIHNLPNSLDVLPIGLVVLVVLFGSYAWLKSREIAELRGLVRGIEQGKIDGAASGKQLDQLFSLITRSQQGYRDLIDTFDDLLFSFSLSGEILAANRSFADLLQHSFSELIGRPLSDFAEFPRGGGLEEADRFLPRFLEHRQWSGVICVRLKREGSLRYFDCAFHAMTRDGEVYGVSAMARDITHERQSEARFTELFETLQEGVYVAEPDGRILDANPALVRLLGYASKEQLLGVTVSDLYCDAPLSLSDRAILERDGLIHGHQISFRTRDGGQVTGLHSASVIRNSAGQIARYHGTIVDLTEHQKMERRIQHEREFARRLMNSLPDLVFVLDREGRYTFASPSIFDTLGYKPEEVVGMRLGEGSDPVDRGAMLSLFEDVMLGRTTQASIEYSARHKAGDWRLLRTCVRPIVDTDGRIEGVIASARDVTEQRRLEQQLVQTERLAAMGQMIAGVAHELNNPLTAILGVTELLRDSSADSSLRRQLDLAYRQARRAAHIVQSLLAFSRPSTPHKMLVNLPDLLQRTLQLHEYALRTNNVSVEFAPPRGLPPVLGDANQLMQVFLNLIVNAEQAIREVRDYGTIRIRLESAGETVSISVEDDGAGIRREILSKIFDPFFTTKRPGRGTGLGLSISLAIVREHNGDIIAAPSPAGTGTIVTVTLPVGKHAPIVASDSPAAGIERTEERPASPLEGRNVLVVDDEEGIRELIEDGLTARGMSVQGTSSPDAAIALASSTPFDVFLCDLNLKGGAGGSHALSPEELRRRLLDAAATRGSSPLFFFMTGDLVDAELTERIAIGGSRLIQKPFRISELAAILAQGLQEDVSRKKTESFVN